MYEVREFYRLEQIEPLAAAWNQLLVQTPGASLFHSLEWLRAYWRHFGARLRWRVIGVFEGGELAGVVPLVVRREHSRVGPIRVLTYPLDNWGSFYGPIGPKPEAVLEAAMAFVRRQPRDWDVLELRWAGMPGTDHRVIGRALNEAGFRAYRTIWDWTAVVDICGRWSDYHKSRSRQWRRNMRAARRRLQQRGNLRIVHYRAGGPSQGQPDPRWDLYDACEQVARNSWQAAATNGTTLCDRSVRAFLREVHQAAAAAGAVDMHLLLLDERPLAFVYNYAWQGYVYGLRIGYDAQAGREGTGTLLLSEVVRACFEHGDRLFDMGIGSLEAKRRLMTRRLPIFRYSYYALPPLRTQVLRVRRWVEQQRLVQMERSLGVISAETGTPLG